MPRLGTASCPQSRGWAVRFSGPGPLSPEIAPAWIPARRPTDHPIETIDLEVEANCFKVMSNKNWGVSKLVSFEKDNSSVFKYAMGHLSLWLEQEHQIKRLALRISSMRGLNKVLAGTFIPFTVISLEK